MIAIAVVGLLWACCVWEGSCGVGCGGNCVRWAGLGRIRVWNGLVHHMHGRLRGCTGPPVTVLPLKYELM